MVAFLQRTVHKRHQSTLLIDRLTPQFLLLIVFLDGDVDGIGLEELARMFCF